MKIVQRITALALTLLFLLSAAGGAFAEDGKRTITQDDALHTQGEDLVNAAGERVFLRGVNLGGWLIQEDWFCPADNGTRGDHRTLETLISRFGTERAYELYRIYWDHWITRRDFADIASMGFNCVRIPFWYRNFQSDDDGTWILNDAGEVDFSLLDRAVDWCRENGLYAILDLHGVNGCQGNQDHCGQLNNYRFLDKTADGKEYRRQATDLWRRIAAHFAGDPAIAMFDLLNEPMCDVPLLKRDYKALNAFYDDTYRAIRAQDPDRVICMMGTWDIGKLPRPCTKGWTDVVYQLHQYDGTVDSYLARIDAGRALRYDVPFYAGEFHPTGTQDHPAKVTVEEILQTYENENVMWTVWTYKGYNSWAAWSDWFIYGSTEAPLTVDPEKDSYEQIAAKWSAMDTDGGQFYSGHLDEAVLGFLPDGKPADPAPDLWHRVIRFFRMLIELITTLFT